MSHSSAAWTRTICAIPARWISTPAKPSTAPVQSSPTRPGATGRRSRVRRRRPWCDSARAKEPTMRMRKISRRAVIGGIAGAALAKPAHVQTLDKIVYNTAWRAQAEAGGAFQAAATGIYKQHGLDVEIRQGGPQTDLNALLLA